MAVLFLIFLGNFTLFSVTTVPIYVSTNRVTGLPFLQILINIFHFLGKAIPTGVRWYLLWFSFVFPWWWVIPNTFSYVCWPLAIYMLEKCLFRSFVHSLTGLVFLLLSCMNPLCILNINPLSDIRFAVTFSYPLRQYFSMIFSYWEHLLCLPWSGSFCCGSFGEPFLCSKWDYWTIKRVGRYLLVGPKGITVSYPSPESYHLSDFNSWPLPKEVWLGLKMFLWNLFLKLFFLKSWECGLLLFSW